ncbi:hydroxymethylglutaryl-CoA synthase, partial [Thraustotheca clavata]
GVGAGTPGHDNVFGVNTFDKLLQGENHIEQLDTKAKEDMLARNIVEIQKADGLTKRVPVQSTSQCIQLASILRPADLVSQYGIPKSLVEGMDAASIAAVAAGLDALKQSGLVSGSVENGWGNWRLPEAMADSTGVLYATSFPALDAAVKEVSRFHTAPKDGSYEFDRKLLFRLLVLANAQLAQIIGAKGPNAQVNATCAGTTVAINMAQDWITSGKCQRVIVVAGDIASSEHLLPWIGSGFRALGAATLASTVAEGAVPFDKRRNGMLLGGGAVGLVLEAQSSTIQRSFKPSTQVRLVASQASNSAFHGASIDKEHLAQELNRFLQTIEAQHGVTRAMIAAQGVYYSHETGTHATPSKSCAFSEIYALRSAFGEAGLKSLVIANTKGYMGHPMGVSFEDVVAVEGLKRGMIPPVVNFRFHDENLSSTPLRLSQGGAYPDVKYALRFAAGFGSQVAFTLYSSD